MDKNFTGRLEQIDENRWRIPADSMEGMRVDGIIYSSQALIQDVISGGAVRQVANMATLPGIVTASLAMPDIHWGYGFCIGGVVATDTQAGGVGYDINCGVRLLRSNLEASDIRSHMAKLIDCMFSAIPCGVGVGGKYKFSADKLDQVMSRGMGFLRDEGLTLPGDIQTTESEGCLAGADVRAVSKRAKQRGSDQCGTLGAGNHFVEVQFVEEIYDNVAADVLGLKVGMVTVMIHSGSRGLGHQVCDDYIKLLRDVPKKYGIHLPDSQLVCAPVESEPGKRYLSAMRAGANFAWCNRQLLAHQVREQFSEFFGSSAESLNLHQVYDVAHNIAKIETHSVAGEKRRLCLHRKGATRAFSPGHPELPPAYRPIGQPVLIPGDMGTASYVLLGTETAMKQSFASTCHGAGRVLSRHEAIKAARGRSITRELASAGIVARSRGKTSLAEEQPDAYKDVDAVVECVVSAGLCRKVARLRPMGVLKG